LRQQTGDVEKFGGNGLLFAKHLKIIKPVDVSAVFTDIICGAFIGPVEIEEG
jgi:hypothetical protein